MAEQRLVVVGGSLAGLRAIEAARKSGYSGPITLVGAEEHLPYDRPPLSKAFLDDDDGEREVPRFRTEGHLRDELGVDVRLGTRATALDCPSKVLHTDDGSVRYSELVIATGAAARTVPGTEGMPGVHTLRTLDDARAVRDSLGTGARVVIVGGGFIGSEVASAARKRRLPVTVVETLPVPLVNSVGEEIGNACAKLHHGAGTDLRCGVKVTAIEQRQDGAKHVTLDDGTVLEADLVVVGIGVTPSTNWLAGSGVELHERDGGVVCDDALRTGQPGVYAAGDVVHWPNPVFDGKQMRLEHWTNAAEQGALAARNALDPTDAKPAATVPYFWSDWYAHRIQFVGIPQADEIRTVSEETGDDRFLALYRRGDRITGAICIDRPTQIMKYRRMIAQRTPWPDALAFAGVA